MPKINQFLLGALALAVISCKGEMSPSQYLLEIKQSHVLNKEYKDENFYALCSYKPSDYITLIGFRKQLEQNEPILLADFNAAKKTYENSAYFVLTLGLTDSSDIMKLGVRNIGEYTRRINDLTFNMGSHTYLLTDEGDTLRADLHELQRSYGMSPCATIIFAFLKSKIPEDSEIRFVYEDPYFGVNKPIAFNFNTNKIFNELPKLKLTSDE